MLTFSSTLSSPKRALPFSLLLAATFILQQSTPSQSAWLFPPPFVAPGQNCFEGVTPSQCKPASATSFSRNPDAPWYDAKGMCCVTPQAGLTTEL